MSRGFNFLVTGIGNLPFTDPGEACKLIFQHLSEAPHWPQLPRVSPSKGMIDQFLEGMPGVVEGGARRAYQLTAEVADLLRRDVPS